MEENQNNFARIKQGGYVTLAGILFVVLGLFCVCYPILASISIDIVVGISLLAGAIFALFQMPWSGGLWGKFFYVVLMLMYAVAGILLLANPFAGTEALMLFFGFMFLAEGIVSIIYWNRLRELSGGFMVMINAIVCVILSILILFNVDMGIWFVGVLVGINFIFVGFSLLLSSPGESGA